MWMSKTAMKSLNKSVNLKVEKCCICNCYKLCVYFKYACVTKLMCEISQVDIC